MGNITGTSGSDTLTGTVGADKINSGDGNDIVDGGAGSDTINAGDGNDIGKWYYTQNIGSTDSYNGNDGTDTLQLYFTDSEWWGNAQIRADVLHYLQFVANPSNGNAYTFGTNGSASAFRPKTGRSPRSMSMAC